MEKYEFIKLVKGLNARDCSYRIHYGNDELNLNGTQRKRAEYTFYLYITGQDTVELESGWTGKSKQEKYAELVKKYVRFINLTSIFQNWHVSKSIKTRKWIMHYMKQQVGEPFKTKRKAQDWIQGLDIKERHRIEKEIANES